MEIDDTFTRMQRLAGDEAMNELATKRVAVFGIGGVGSWCAETLIRSGIRHITLVDADVVCRSNINRQLVATNSTLGRPKVEVMRERMLDINPLAEVRAVEARYTPDTSSDFELNKFDYIIDAIDSLGDKADLILRCTELMPRVKFFSSMGAALKLDPSRIEVAEFYKVKGCRLAAALRNRFKRMGQYPAHKFKCVFSDELLPNRGDDADRSGAMNFGKVAYNGAAMHITAIFGITLASLVVNDIIKRAGARAAANR